MDDLNPFSGEMSQSKNGTSLILNAIFLNIYIDRMHNRQQCGIINHKLIITNCTSQGVSINSVLVVTHILFKCNFNMSFENIYIKQKHIANIYIKATLLSKYLGLTLDIF